MYVKHNSLSLQCKENRISCNDVHMFENPIVQDNLNILKKYDMEVVEPAVGYLACGDTGQEDARSGSFV